MVLSRSRHVGLLLLASFVLITAFSSASDEPSAASQVHAQKSDNDSKTDATLASTQYQPVYDSYEPQRQLYHHSDNSNYYTSRSKHDDRHDDPNNQYYAPREQQHHGYADESERHYSSEQYKDRQYNSRPSYEQYNAHDSYYEQEHQAHDHYVVYKQHHESYMQGPAYKEREIVQVCLQRYGNPTYVNGTKYTQEFVCCNGPTTDDSCIRNSTDGYGSHHDTYDAYEREDNPSFMDTMLTPQIAAVCSMELTASSNCPEWAQQATPFSPGCINAVTAKCAFTKFASQCGCPAHAQGLEFESRAYASLLDGISCGYDCVATDVSCRFDLSNGIYNPVITGGPYSGAATHIQGGLSGVFARGEKLDIEGSVEYTLAFFAADNPPARLLPESLATQDLPVFKSGQLKVRLALD